MSSLPKKLQEARDAAADKYGEEFKVYPKAYPRDDFHAGFDSCYELLKPEIEKLVEALHIAEVNIAALVISLNGKYDPEYPPLVVAQQAQSQWREFMGGR